MKSIKLETLRTKVWSLEKTTETLQKEVDLIKLQIAQLESDGKENSSGVEAAIDPNRILSRRGSNSKKLALALALKKIT